MMKKRSLKIHCVHGLAGAVMALMLMLSASAQPVKGAREGGIEPGGVEARTGVITPTGLVATFPLSHRCEQISSPFGSATRYDGSRRRSDRFEGLHGGIDLTLREGTPLLAVMSGQVMAVGEGGRLEGIFIWLRHAPQDSGLPFFVFSKYQHLQRPSALKPGDRVRVGEIVGMSGKTGTVGGHYGAAGYPHLHLTTRYSPGGEFEMLGAFQSMLASAGSFNDDPLHLYRKDLVDLEFVGRRPADLKVTVPIMDTNGKLVPADAIRIWPVACVAN